MAPAKEIGPDQFAQPRRQDVIRGISDQKPVEHRAEGQPARRGQDDPPAPSAQRQCQPICAKGERQPFEVDLAQFDPELHHVDAGHGEPEEDGADGYADGALEQRVAQQPADCLADLPHRVVAVFRAHDLPLALSAAGSKAASRVLSTRPP